MPTSPHLLLTAYILLTHTLTTAMWLVAGRWMGLSRRSASEWMRASIANGSALLITVADGGQHEALLLALASTLAVLGAASSRRGLLSFLRLREPRSGLLRLMVVTAAFNLMLCVPMGWPSLAIGGSCLAVIALLADSIRHSHAAIHREFGRGTAMTSSAVLGATALVFTLTGLTLLIGLADSRSLPSLALRQVMLVFVTSMLSILTAVVQGYIVVMRLVMRLQHLSQHDSLTGLLNRRAIELSLAKEAHRLKRFDEPYAVLLLDIDHFKRINDELGHAAGDEVLRQVALTLSDEAREVDRVARHGGEEFCVLLPHTEQEGAVQAAERLRTAVEERVIGWHADSLRITISVGLACATDPHEATDALMRRADQALYHAKAQGRNQVVAAPQSPA
jgi:diguanylate cyclase (GGDEF)-like protein